MKCYFEKGGQKLNESDKLEEFNRAKVKGLLNLVIVVAYIRRKHLATFFA